MAVAGLVLGIIGLILPLVGILFSILGVIFGAIGAFKNKKKGLAIAGTILGVSAIIIYLFLFLLSWLQLKNIQYPPINYSISILITWIASWIGGLLSVIFLGVSGLNKTK